MIAHCFILILILIVSLNLIYPTTITAVYVFLNLMRIFCCPMQEWWWPESGDRPKEPVPEWAHVAVLFILTLETCVGTNDNGNNDNKI